MKSNDHIESLRRIQRVKAPPMLLSRIKGQLALQKEEKIAPAWALSLAAAIALLVLFNVNSLRQNTSITSQSIAIELATDLQLIQSNQLYDE